MTNFTKTFITNNGTYIFRFSKVESTQVRKYYVSVEDGANRIAGFDIKLNKDGKWKVVEPAPSFIVQEEQLLGATIEEKNQQSYTKRTITFTY
jgi:hypothetical protein